MCLQISRPKALIASSSTFLLLACTPTQEVGGGGEECRDSNVNLVAAADQQYTAPIPQTPAIDAIMNVYLAQPDAPPGCAVGVVSGNEVRFLKGYGLADAATGTPYTHATMQGVGSVSKTITALAILKLVEQGEISLDDQANQYVDFPHFKLLGVTIRDLLTHHSGLPLYPDFESDLDTEAELQQLYPNLAHPGIQPRLVQQAYNSTPRQSLASNRGIYSNTGYSVLGAVIDAVTTSPGFQGRHGYEAYTYWNVALKEGVVSGPTMTSICLDTYWRENDILNLATGYQPDGATEFPNYVNPNGGPGGWRGPAGGWAMTIGDLARLTLGINTNAFVTPALKAEMLAPSINLDGFNSPYGFGVFKDVNFFPTFMAGGNIDGYTARSTFWPGQGVGVALMCNREDAPSFRTTTNDIAELFLP